MVKNVTRNTLITPGHILADSPAGRARGLMFTLPMKKAMVLKFPSETSVQLHMFFVFYPIDVLFLDKDCRVVEILANFRPFTFYCAKHKAKFVVEVPAGSISSSHTKIGDKIAFFQVVERRLKNERRLIVKATRS